MKCLVILLMVAGLVFTAIPAESNEIVEKISAKYPARCGVFYDGEWDAIYGVTLKENIFTEDVDLALYNDGHEAILLGLDINVSVTKNTSVGIGFVAGFDHIEKLRGEFRAGPSVVIKFRF